jgi:TonB-linked SusC/RagA family outer membrane protein
MKHIVSRSTKEIILLALITGSSLSTLYAQNEQPLISDSSRIENLATTNHRVTGVVRDISNAKPLPGINISAGKYSATITDEKGEFRISVPDPDGMLTISGQGYQRKEVALKGRTSLETSLFQDTYPSFYGEAVLPYGTSSRLRTAYSIDALSVDDNWQRTSESSDTYLQGKAAGLNVVRRSGTPGTGGNMFLHGFNSMYATTQPLVIIDGMLYDNFSYGNSLITGYVASPLSNIDMKDIDSYTLIKDGGSFYGTRGGNGALLITTARAKSQATTIDFGAYGGYNSRVSRIPVMNAGNFRTYLSELLTTVPGENAASIQAKPYMNDNLNPDYYRYHNTTDWQNEVLSNSYNQNYYLKVTGGDNIATYGLSVGYLKGSGITTNTDLQRYQTRFNADLKLTTKLSAVANLSFVNNEHNLMNQGIAPKTNPLYLALVKAPFLRPHEVNAANEQSPLFTDVDALNTSNPSALISDMQAVNKNYRFLGSVSFKFDITKKLSLHTLGGVNYDKVRENIFIPEVGVVSDTLTQAVTTNSLGTNTQRLFSLYNDTRLSYAADLSGNQHLSANLGLRYNESTREIDYGRGYSSATDDYVSVGSGAPGLRSVGGENGDWNWMNVYGNAGYELKNRYFFSFNIAADASSRFGKTASGALTLNNNKFAVLPSAAAAWLISSENFFNGGKMIEALKLRVSYGLSGNDDIGNYTAKRYYTSQNFLGTQGVTPGNIANTGLKWETVKKANIGVDIALFAERLSLTADYFQNHTVNMITFEPTTSIATFEYALTNGGGMKTNGVDLSLFGRLLNKTVKLDLGLNVSGYRNRLTKIPGNRLLTTFAGGTILSEVGSPSNQFYGFKTAGVYSSDAEAASEGLKNRREDGSVTAFRGGDMRFIDKNSDGYIDNLDRQVIGDPNPRLTGAFTALASYKRWSMDAVMSFTAGNDIYNYTRRNLEAMNGYGNQLDRVQNRWKAPGQVTNMPRAEFGDPAGNSRFSDRWIENGSYLRLRTVSLTYDIPRISNGIKSVRIYLTGNNVFTFTKYLGYDPEFSAAGSIFSQGTDIGLEPQFRTVQLGVRVGL